MYIDLICHSCETSMVVEQNTELKIIFYNDNDKKKSKKKIHNQIVCRMLYSFFSTPILFMYIVQYKTNVVCYLIL